MTAIYVVAGALLTISALLALYRIVRGPSILDRVIASDVLLTNLILVIGAEMVYNGHTRTVPIMLVMAATAIFGSISVARYVSTHDAVTVDEVEHLPLPVGAVIAASPVAAPDGADVGLDTAGVDHVTLNSGSISLSAPDLGAPDLGAPDAATLGTSEPARSDDDPDQEGGDHR